MTRPSPGRYVLFALLTPFTVPFLAALAIAAALARLLVELVEAASGARARVRELMSREVVEPGEAAAAEVRRTAPGSA